MPLVSGVMIFLNAERFIEEAIESVFAQTYTAWELLLVDDGSTDASTAIAAGYAGSDQRFRLIRQANRGLGAARNVGIDAGTGELLTFVDSDDVLPPYAFEVLVGVLAHSGSDFASGNVALLTSRGLRQSPLHRGTHRATVLRTALIRQRNLVYDRLACNKVFRRTFWDGQKLRFPEGVRYEDIPVTVPAASLPMTKGARVICSTPPATTSSASPHSIRRAASLKACRPEPHSRLTVTPVTSTGSPASKAHMRATLRLSSPA